MHALEPGTAIARYRVVSLLGSGGMGQVYLARDESLDRPVALKILPPDLVKNDERVRRFVQEAKSASSLNHPNIVTIYEIGEADGIQYIAMELVSGHTLKALIHDEKTDLRTLVRYLAQAADGLAKAHAAGIVHRDLKPENIMVTSDGFAKVVDFGLAKLTESSAGIEPNASQTRPGRATGPGMVLGTVGYMSPEQVQGKSVDHRSDVFSFGCVLYEAATRERPFQADSDVETLHQILRDAPPPVEGRNPNVPSDLRRVIRRCLAKSPERRLQSMKDVALDLAEIDETWDTLSASTGSGTATSAIGVPRTSHRPGLLAIAAVIIGLAGIGSGVWQWVRGDGFTSSAPPALQVTTVARIPDMTWGLMSADGRLLAYSVFQSGHHSLLVRQLATSQDLVVMPPQELEILLRAVAPDSSYLYFTSRHEAFAPQALYRVPAVGGEPVRILEGVSDAALSSDGTRLAAIQSDPRALVIANADGTGRRTLVTLKDNNLVAPAWSPDGRYVVVSVARPGVRREQLTAFDAADGREQKIGNAGWAIHGVLWPAGSDTLFVTATDWTSGNTGQLWALSFPDGAVRRITNDTSPYDRPLVISADGQTITTSVARSGQSVYSAPADRPDQAVPLAGDAPIVGSFVRVRDGRLLYRTWERGRRTLWIMATDGSRRRRISPAQMDVSAVFASVRADVVILQTSENLGEATRLWRMDAAGGGLAELPGDNNVVATAVSPDGADLYYVKGSPGSARRTMDPVIWRRPIDGGAEQRAGQGVSPGFSPDGRLFHRFAGALVANTLRRVDIVEVATGRTIRTLNVPTDFSAVRWSLASDALVGARRPGPDNIPNVWRYPIDGSPGSPLTHFGPDQFNGNFTYTADGRLLFFRTERTPGEVVQFRNFQ